MFFNDFLTALHVPHTQAYSDNRFATMPFMSMFGMSRLLDEYGVDSMALALTDKNQMPLIPTPFVAPVSGSEWVIVTDASDNMVDYITQGKHERAAFSRFRDAWTGVAFIATANHASREPDYNSHRLAAAMTSVRNYGLWALMMAVAVYFFIVNGLWRNWWSIALPLVLLTGLAASFMLVLKTIGVRSKAIDNVCATIQEGGCDTVIDTGGTFLGIFHWSEVGLAYFSVSLLALFLWPDAWSWLALFNIFCLPYTVWSVSYQRFKAHAWCTLCLVVQLTLWLTFICWLGYGWWNRLTLSATPFLLAAAYVIVCLTLNRLIPYITTKNQEHV
ncbi:MAG: vitamin K epoxide reductase family protein [Bacteroidales bacterium]|nr:vitamin K epoxide reductase family protein [Bacteroidales bacterium]